MLEAELKRHTHMRLLYTLTTYPPSTGGAQLHQHMVACQLQGIHHIQVVSFWKHNRTDWLLGTTVHAPSHSDSYIVDGVPVHQIGLSVWEKIRIAPFVPIYYPLMDVALPPIAARLEPHLNPYARDAELIHNVRIGREAMSYASLYAARRRNLPFVLTPVHHPRWVGWRYRAYNRLYRLADGIIALTQAEKGTLVELGVREERITVTGMGPVIADTTDPGRFLCQHNIHGPVILFLGQHYRYKGYQQLLQAARLVWQQVPDAHFVFVGPAVGRSERDFAPYADPRIHRLGKLDLQGKTDALAACSLLCVPSTQESFGGVYTEAWSFAKPVIACNIPAVSEVVADGVDGYLVRQNAAQIADRVCYLLLHPQVAQTMGQAGHRKVQTHYAWQQIAARTDQAYRKVLTGSMGGAAPVLIEREKA